MKFIKVITASDNHELVDNIQIDYLDEENLKAKLVITVRDFKKGFIKPNREWLVDSGKIQELQSLIKGFKNKWKDYMDNNDIPNYKILTGNVWKDINYIVDSCCVKTNINKEV